jgi:tellurite resistance protein
VFLFPNRSTNIQDRLACTWLYRRPKLLVGSEVIGPLTDDEFLQAIRLQNIATDTEVSSPDVTKGEWVLAQRITLSTIQERIEQRQAEKMRLERKEGRQRERDKRNMEVLHSAIATAISDGRITLSERGQLLQFAQAAQIPERQVETLLYEHADKLLQSAINETLEDGFLEPSEKRRISDLATGLGISISLTDEQSRRLHACELAWQLANQAFVSKKLSIKDISLNSSESALAHTEVDWFEIVKLKRPQGIQLDHEHCLKLVGSGDCLLTDKRLALTGEFCAKRVSLSTVAQARRFQDGVFCNRSSGKSIFLRPRMNDTTWDEFSILLEYTVSKQPVLGIEPRDTFIPTDVVPIDRDRGVEAWESFSIASDNEPRYTFRVVGDHVGDRGYWIDRLRIGDLVQVVREPSNPHDENAVSVYDGLQHQLGYLKREVAKWFGPMLDRGCRFRSQAYRKPSSGGLIIAMFD